MDGYWGTLLAAFALMLARFSGQWQFNLGTPVANRPNKNWENLVGLFVNTLVQPCDLSGDPSVVKLLERLRQMHLDCQDHACVPFEQVVQPLEPERRTDRNPLFQVMFA